MAGVAVEEGSRSFTHTYPLRLVGDRFLFARAGNTCDSAAESELAIADFVGSVGRLGFLAGPAWAMREPNFDIDGSRAVWGEPANAGNGVFFQDLSREPPGPGDRAPCPPRRRSRLVVSRRTVHLRSSGNVPLSLSCMAEPGTYRCGGNIVLRTVEPVRARRGARPRRLTLARAYVLVYPGLSCTAGFKLSRLHARVLDRLRRLRIEALLTPALGEDSHPVRARFTLKPRRAGRSRPVFNCRVVSVQ